MAGIVKAEFSENSSLGIVVADVISTKPIQQNMITVVGLYDNNKREMRLY